MFFLCNDKSEGRPEGKIFSCKDIQQQIVLRIDFFLVFTISAAKCLVYLQDTRYYISSIYTDYNLDFKMHSRGNCMQEQDLRPTFLLQSRHCEMLKDQKKTMSPWHSSILTLLPDLIHGHLVRVKVNVCILQWSLAPVSLHKVILNLTLAHLQKPSIS